MTTSLPRLITSAYRGHVDSEINDQYRTLSGSLRFLNNIVRFPGCGTFDPEGSFVAVRQAGAAARLDSFFCSRVRQDVGHVTQVCVLPDYRSHGLGESIDRGYGEQPAGTVAILVLSLTVAAQADRACRGSLPAAGIR